MKHNSERGKLEIRRKEEIIDGRVWESVGGFGNGLVDWEEE